MAVCDVGNLPPSPGTVCALPWAALRSSARLPARPMRKVRTVLSRAGCPADLECPWHAMRRTFATLFNESGGSRDALEQILGHTTSGNKITARYVLPSIAHLAREMDKLTLRPTAPAKVLRFDDYRQHA